MKTIKIFLLSGFFFILLISCDETIVSTAIPKAEAAKTTTEAEEAAEKGEIPLIIFQNSFLTVSPGTPIAEYKTVIEEDLLQTGEGDFVIYNIKDAQSNVIAYFLADPVETDLVGNICITSPLAYTEDNIRIGNTFGDLVKKYEGLEVHGSEIESQTFANLGSLYFKIDEPHAAYNLERSAVSKDAKIIQIVIRR